MAFSDKEILKEMEAGRIYIYPFDEKNLSTSSYDVALGEWYFREKKPDGRSHLYNFYNKAHTDAVWGTEPERAKMAGDVLKDFSFSGISKDDRVILLEPGETILAHTNEFIGGRETVTTMMKARSSLGRNFIEVCKCAGWGDVGYINRWTMEITNNSRHYSIPLVVGRRVAQIIFFRTGEIRGTDYTGTGKYQSETDGEKLRDSWEPRMMLPRTYKDREVRGNTTP
jgi:dCTP deaminase